MDLQAVLGDDFSESIAEKLKGKQIFVFNEGEEIKLNGREFVPIGRFNEVNQKAQDFEAQLEKTNAELKSLSEKAGNNEELKKRLETLSEESEKNRSESEKRLERLRKETAVRLRLIKDGARDDSLLLPKFDLDKVELVGDRLRFYDDQLKTIKEEFPWAFGERKVVGVTPGKSDGPILPPNQKNPWSKENFNLTEQGRILEKDPELAKKLKQSAK